MNKFIVVLFCIGLSLLSCENEPKPNLVVKGKLEGVRKGSLYLQKMEDTLLINLDSISFLGDKEFTLKTYVEEPQLMFLYLKRFGSDKDAEYFDFFAEAGEFKFDINAENFSQSKAEKAPDNQIQYQNYLSTLKRFNDINLDLISERIQTDKNDSLAMQKVQDQFDNLLKRKYLYTINFALKNPDLEIAPFVILSEAYQANKKYLDTVYNTLTPEVKDSKYGIELQKLIELRADEIKQQNIEVKTLDEDV